MQGRPFPAVVIATFGVSTPFAYWGFNLVRAIVEAVAGPTLSLHVYSLQQLRDGFANRDGASVVMASDLPEADLAGFVASTGVPVIVFADAAEVMLAWTMTSRGLASDAAARLCARVCAAVAPPLEPGRRLVLSPRPDASPASVVAEIVDFLWPGRGGRLAAQTFEFLAESGQIERDRVGGAAEAAGDATQPLALALAPYAELAQGRTPAAIDWPLSLFTRPDGRPWGEPFDLAGPARPLLYGPYMYLPVGDWTARVEFEVVGAYSGVEAMTDVRMNDVVDERNFLLPAHGVFYYDLSFAVRDPHLPVEIRLFLRKSAIEGVFLPRSVTVRPGRRPSTAGVDDVLGGGVPAARTRA